MACYHPISLKSPYSNVYIDVPCGKCAGCRKDLQNSWFVRFIEENKKLPCRFITLTYDEEHIPYHIDNDDVIHYDVDKAQLQKFFKRMRKKNTFKYFCVSEYGGKFQRPHYHLLLFSKERIDIEKYWKYGFVYDLPAKRGGFKYVTKYLLKGSNVPEGSNPNFAIMSKRPAIGKDFLDNMDYDWYAENGYMDHQTRYPLPRYYRKKIYEKMIDGGESIKRANIEQLENSIRYNDLYAKWQENNIGMDFHQWIEALDNKNTIKQNQLKK